MTPSWPARLPMCYAAWAGSIRTNWPRCSRPGSIRAAATVPGSGTAGAGTGRRAMAASQRGAVRRPGLPWKRRRDAGRPAGRLLLREPGQSRGAGRGHTCQHRGDRWRGHGGRRGLDTADRPGPVRRSPGPHPGTYVRNGLRRARTLIGSTIEQAAAVLGNGSRISAQDTVPFALWAAARYHRDYPAAIRLRAGRRRHGHHRRHHRRDRRHPDRPGRNTKHLAPDPRTPSRLDRLTPARLPQSADAQNSHSRTLRPTAAITARTYRSAGICAPVRG
jgi:hypothetical protein